MCEHETVDRYLWVECIASAVHSSKLTSMFHGPYNLSRQSANYEYQLWGGHNHLQKGYNQIHQGYTQIQRAT